MSNEILLILSILVIYGSLLVFYKLYGKNGLFCFTCIATISANIEVLIFVYAFGMEMTLGNVLFASTFLVTDIISEVYGKKEAKKAVNYGIATSVVFIIFSQYWLLYSPVEWNNETFDAMKIIFSGTARSMIASLIVYAIVQKFDVWAYHKWWDLTKKWNSDSKKYLWIRNNGSTLISQLLNSILFNVGAFYGTEGVDTKTLLSFIFAGYAIFIITSIADTPFIYLARKIKPIGEK